MTSRQLITRRNVLSAGGIGASGLAAAALLGCGGGSKSTPQTNDTPAGAGGSQKSKLLNADLLALNDPSLPYPFIAPEPDLPPKKGGIFRIAWNYDLASMDPTTSTSGGTLGIPSAVAQGLLRFVNGARLNPSKIEIEPDLATSWETSPDGLTYTFKLTDKAKFHNKPPVSGRPFTAEDARVVLDRYRSTGVSRGAYENVVSMTPVNPQTLQIKLKQPQPDFLLPLGARESLIYAIEMLDKMSKLQDIAGTGPFILKEALRGERITFTSNADFWRGAPYMDGSEWRILPDPSARLAAFRAGQFDLPLGAILNGKTDADSLAKEGNVITTSPILNGSRLIGFNLKNPKFQDERVRQGLSLLYNRERAIQILAQGFGVPYMQLLPWIFVFDKVPTQAEVGAWARYDVAEGKKLLQAAGAENFSFEYLRALVYNSDSLVAYMLDNYRSAGVNITVKTVDQTTRNAQWQTGTYPEAIGGGVDSGAYTADGFFKLQLRSGASLNRINLSDPDIDTWADQQSTELDPKKRRELQRKIWDRMGQKAYRTEAGGGYGYFVVPPWLRNFTRGSFASGISQGSDDLRYAATTWLDK